MVMNKRGFVLACLGLTMLSVTAWAQVNRYFVSFSDKTNSPYSIADPGAFLSPSAIERRLRHGVSVSERDLPVNPNFVTALSSAGVSVFYTLRWVNGAVVQCDASLLPTLSSLPFVNTIERIAPGARVSGAGGRRSPETGRKKTTSVIENQAQLSMLGLDQMHADGITGEGVMVAIFDGGFQGVNQIAPFAPLFEQGRVNLSLSYDFVGGSANVFQYDDHGTEVFSVIAAQVPDSYIGGAYNASFQLYVTEEVRSEYRIEEYNWMAAAERADSAGVDVISSSLGYYDFDDNTMDYPKSAMDGNTAIVTKAATWASERGILVVTSAGNEGNIASWRIVTAPADADNIIAVGNVGLTGSKSGSSSTGPTADGRIKPDLSALGMMVRVITKDGGLGSASGTSLAAPLVTSLVAGLLQKYPDVTNTELIDLMKKTATKGSAPDNLTGWGVPSYVAVVNYKTQGGQENQMDLYPNPASTDTVTLSPRNPNDFPDARVELLDARGIRLAQWSHRFNWSNSTFQLPLADLKSGLYFVRVSQGEKRFVFRLVRMR